MEKKVLFLFTKYFPFGTMEKYINHELSFLVSEFEKVIIIPTEYYGSTEKKLYTSALPANTEVLALNELVKRESPSAWKYLPAALNIWLYEFRKNPYRKFLLRHFSKNKNVLFYQLICAGLLKNYLQMDQFKGKKLFFYSYWFHHSTLILAILKKKKVIAHFVSRAHAIDLYNENWPVAGDIHKPLPFAWFKMKHISFVAAISGHGKKFLLEKYPQYAEKISRNYLGVNDYGKGPEPASPFAIVTCSNFNLNKRLNRIPGVLSKLDFEVKWVHFGSGGEGESEVKKMIADLPAHITVELKGYVPNDQITSYYASNPVDLLMNLSRMEGLPVSIMEAIGFGIPVIATGVFGTPELVSEGNGWLLDVEFDDETVAGYIRMLHDDPAMSEKMRQASRKTFETHFRADQTYPDFIAGLLMPSANKF